MSFLVPTPLPQVSPKSENSPNLDKDSKSDSLSNLMHHWILPQLSNLIRMFELLPHTIPRMLSDQPNHSLGDLLHELKHNPSIPTPFTLLAWSKLMRSCQSDQSNLCSARQSCDPNPMIKSVENEEAVLDLTQKSGSLSNHFVETKQDPTNLCPDLYMDTGNQCQELAKWPFEVNKGIGFQTHNLNGSDQFVDQSILGCSRSLLNPCLCDSNEPQHGFSSKPESEDFRYTNSPHCSSNLMNNSSSNEIYHFGGQDRWIDQYNAPWDTPNDISYFPLTNGAIDTSNKNDHLNTDSFASQPSSQSTLHIPSQSASIPTPGLPPPLPPQSFSPPLNFGAFTLDQNMICPICRKCFRFEKNLLRHLQKTHATGTGESVLKCKLCNYTTRHYSNMYVHIRTHTGDKPYSCSACGVSFTQGSSLKLHIRSRHNDNGTYFSLTRKPGKSNLTKLWTRVLKKDLPKFTSMKSSQLVANFAGSNESCWNDWQLGGTSLSNSAAAMMMIIMQQSKSIPNLRSPNNFNANPTVSIDGPHQEVSNFPTDRSQTGECAGSDLRKPELPQLTPSPSSYPSLVVQGSGKRQKSGLRGSETPLNSMIQQSSLPWKHLGRTKKTARAFLKNQCLTSENVSLGQNDPLKQDLMPNTNEQFGGTQQDEERGFSDTEIVIKQEYYDPSESQEHEQLTSHSEFYDNPLNGPYCLASNLMDTDDNLMPKMMANQNRSVNQTEQNQSMDKFLPFSIAAIQPR